MISHYVQKKHGYARKGRHGAALYIPLCSDKTRIKTDWKTLKKLFISHYVQIKRVEKRKAIEWAKTLYIPLCSDKTQKNASIKEATEQALYPTMFR